MAARYMRAQLDGNGKLTKLPDSPSAKAGAIKVISGGIGGLVTPDGYSINTTHPPYQPSGVPPAKGGPRELADPAGFVRGAVNLGEPLPPQTNRTIGDTLSAKGVSWAWFAGGYRAALEDGLQDPGKPRNVIYHRAPGSPNFQPHHQPFNYYKCFAPGTADRAQHLLDGDDFMKTIDMGTLPQVSFYKPAGVNTQHPSYTDVITGEENGGYWDHVPPPTGPGWGDRWGPGSRIPAILIGPTVKRGYIDSTTYDTTSLLKMLTERFQLESWPGMRTKMGNFSAALN